MSAPIRGTNGVIRVGPTPVTVAEVRRFEYTVEGDEEDTSVMGTPRVDLVNIKTRGTIECYSKHLAGSDPAVDAGQALFIVGNVVAAELYPNGVGSGKPSLVGNIKLLSLNFSQEVAGFAVTNWNFEVDGAETFTDAAQT